MATTKRYRYEIHYLTPMAKRVSDMMNAFDLPGRYGVQTDIVKFTSDSDIAPVEYRDKLKEAYETAGGEVLEISGGEVI